MSSITTNPTTTGTPVAQTTQIHRVYIRTTAQAIWDALTSPEWSNKYGYGGYVHYDLRPGGALVVNPGEEMIEGSVAAGYPPPPDVVIDGEVLEVEAPFHLKTTWRMLMDPSLADEGFSTISYDIKELEAGYCSLTITHELEGMPNLFMLVGGAYGDDPNGGGGGHNWVLSDLKSLLETGKRMADA